MGKPVLYVVACGGRPAGDIAAHLDDWHADGWRVCVIATPSALKFIDRDVIKKQTGFTVRYDYKQPDEPDVLPPADAFAVVPATFNTINKLAAGISDTLALGLLNEGIGADTPIVAVPTPNQALAKHPAFRASVIALRSWGVNLIFDPQRYPLPTPNMGPPAAALFPWQVLRDELLLMLDGVRQP
ncbi:flavoprotein [Catellatospora citrea]|uniref:Flavoprotein n=1 Tax=Catellatospora citrea TaxID=53366 RepID=A0A8J3NZW4_9ACTN|nr:flavoprotein [Catellatospora citrea]GIF98785.1 flavoprotein [Catellatospora citrea]